MIFKQGVFDLSFITVISYHFYQFQRSQILLILFLYLLTLINVNPYLSCQFYLHSFTM